MSGESFFEEIVLAKLCPEGFTRQALSCKETQENFTADARTAIS